MRSIQKYAVYRNNNTRLLYNTNSTGEISGERIPAAIVSPNKSVKNRVKITRRDLCATAVVRDDDIIVITISIRFDGTLVAASLNKLIVPATRLTTEPRDLSRLFRK